jgi:hypothetical protein
MGGRSTYSAALFDAILKRMASGESLLKICADEGMPNRATVWRWIARHRDRAGRYADAKHKNAVASDRIEGYSDTIAEAICDQIMCGKTLHQICALDGMPSIGTLTRWLRQHKDFDALYARAKEIQADILADEILDLADDPTIDPTRLRVRVDTRKWMAAKFKPRRYGERTAVELTGSVQALSDEELDRQIRDLLAEADGAYDDVTRTAPHETRRIGRTSRRT